MKNEKTLKDWMFTPFRFIAGSKALALGILVLLLLSVLGYLSNTFFDGALDIHFGSPAFTKPYVIHAFCVFSGWVVLTLVFYITARIVSSSSIRLIDIAGTVALSKTPFILAALWGFLSIAHLDLGDIQSLNLGELMNILMNNILPIMLTIVIAFLPVIWFFVLMYNAYTVSANVKGTKAIISFIIAVLVSEVISKILIMLVLPFLQS